MVTKQFIFISKENKLKNISAITSILTQQQEVVIAAAEFFDSKAPAIQIATVNQVTKQIQWNQLTNNKILGNITCIQIYNENDKSYCAALVHKAEQLPCVNFWNYKKERLITYIQIKASIDKISLHPLRPKNMIFGGQSYFRFWELFFQTKQIKESNYQPLTLKQEKENRLLDMSWVKFQPSPILITLMQGNKIFIFQNDLLQKMFEIKIDHVNVIEILVQEQIKEESDDMLGLNTILDDIQKDKPERDQIQKKDTQEKNENISIQQEQSKKEKKKQMVIFSCMSPTRKGFLIGGTQGIILFYEVEKNLAISQSLAFQMNYANKNIENNITQIFCSTNDSFVTICNVPAWNPIVAEKPNINFNVFNLFQLDADVSAIQPFFPIGVHTKRINAMSCSKCKSLLVTCSQDHTVKIWNYFSNENIEKKGVFSQYFKEEPICVSMHTTGLFLAIAFGNGFKIFSILNDSLYSIKETALTNCKVIQYSNGGHYLIANEKASLYLYDTILYDCLRILDGHTSTIKQICISLNDINICSTDIQGYVIFWDLQKEDKGEISKQAEHHEPQTYESIQIDYTSKSQENFFVGSTKEKYLRVFTKDGENIICEFERMPDYYISCITISIYHKVIFLGTTKGTIRFSLWPITDSSLEQELISGMPRPQVKFKMPEFFELQAHSAPVNSMIISHDYMYLISGAEDGTVFLFKIKQFFQDQKYDILSEAKKSSQIANLMEEKAKLTVSLNDLFMEKCQKIADQNELIKKFNFEVVKAEQTIKIETQKLELGFKKDIDIINKKFDTDIGKCNEKGQTFKQSSNKDIIELTQQLKFQNQKFDDQLSIQKNDQEKKVNYENWRNEQLEENLKQLKRHQKELINQLCSQNSKELQNIKQSYMEKCEKIQIKYNNLIESAKCFGDAFITRLDNEDKEREKDMEVQIHGLKIEIAKLKEENDKIKQEVDMLLQKNQKLKQDDTQFQKNWNHILSEHNEIRRQNLDNDVGIIKMQHQLLERLQVIDGKEETCKNAKDEQINLENFRYMLEQKIKMLQTEKNQIIVRITDKEKALKQMFNELISESQQNEKKYQVFKKQNHEIEMYENQTKKIDIEIFFNTSLLKIINQPGRMTNMANRLYSMLEQGKDNKYLEGFVSKRHISNEDINEILRIQNEKGNDINDELLKQGKWMTKKLWLIDATCKKLKEIRLENIEQIVNQNTKLIEECNILRSENERYRKFTKNEEKLLTDSLRRKEKLLKKKRIQKISPQKFPSEFQQSQSMILQKQQQKVVLLFLQYTFIKVRIIGRIYSKI